MKSIFDIPNTLLEAIDRLTANGSWRRYLDIRPLVLVAGLEPKKQINEVFDEQYEKFSIPDEEAKNIHDVLSIKSANVPPHVFRSVSHYGGTGSEDINHHMWMEHLHGSPIPYLTKQHIENIKSVLNPSTDVHHVKLYTGLPQSPAATAGLEWNSTRPIKVLHLPAFTSTSTNFDVAASFTKKDDTTKHHISDHHGEILPNSRHVLELNFHGNIPDAASLIKHVGATHEEEVLLGPNKKFELHPRPTLVHGGGFNDPVYVWKATHNPDLPGNFPKTRSI